MILKSCYYCSRESEPYDLCVECAEEIVNNKKEKRMSQLKISKIESLPNSKKVMICDMVYTQDYDDFVKHPAQIILLGDVFL